MKIVKKFSINGIAMRLDNDATELKKELWTIDELEDASGLSKRTIKYYAQLGLISPAIGETRSARYSVSHLNEIEFIRNLQNKGYTLKQIQEMKPRAEDTVPKKRKIAAPHLFYEFYLGQGVYIKFDNKDEQFESQTMKELALKMSEFLYKEHPKKKSNSSF